jgi:hypothetical protein
MANGSKIQIDFNSLKTFVKVTNLDFYALNVFIWIIKKKISFFIIVQWFSKFSFYKFRFLIGF